MAEAEKQPSSHLAKRILAGQGKVAADIVLRDVQLLDVVTGDIKRTDIAIVGDRIVGAHHVYEGDGHRKVNRVSINLCDLHV